MFEILVYVYETYYRPEACPEPEALAKKLSAVGFEDDEITEAIDWLSVLTQPAHCHIAEPDDRSFRVYAKEELAVIGASAIGLIQFFETSHLINTQQREVIIERALATNEAPLSIDKLKIIVMLMLWSQGKEPDSFLFDELILSDEQLTPPLFH